jgi:hypothetical protein
MNSLLSGVPRLALQQEVNAFATLAQGCLGLCQQPAGGDQQLRTMGTRRSGIKRSVRDGWGQPERASVEQAVAKYTAERFHGPRGR